MSKGFLNTASNMENSDQAFTSGRQNFLRSWCLFLKLGYDESIFKGRKPVVKAHLCQLFCDILQFCISTWFRILDGKSPVKIPSSSKIRCLKWRIFNQRQVMEDLRHDERLEASVHEDCVEADDGEWWNGGYGCFLTWWENPTNHPF